MIDWLNPSDDVIEARRIGYEERDAEFSDEIERLRERVEELEKAFDSVAVMCMDGVVAWSLVTKESMSAVVEKAFEVLKDQGWNAEAGF
jgi:hypothetical protein